MTDKMFMRTLIALTLALVAVPAGAQLVLPPEEERAPSRLAPLDMKSDWHARFEAAGLQLGSVLGDGPSGQWQNYFGGAWLNAADRDRISALVADKNLAFYRVLVKSGAYETAILGWQPPDGGDAYVALAGRPEADAIICWRDYGDSPVPWPTTAREAEDARQHACVRVSYSMRFDAPQWRAFIDPPPPAG
jgi:hypothetical protein